MMFSSPLKEKIAVEKRQTIYQNLQRGCLKPQFKKILWHRTLNKKLKYMFLQSILKDRIIHCYYSQFLIDHWKQQIIENHIIYWFFLYISINSYYTSNTIKKLKPNAIHINIMTSTTNFLSITHAVHVLFHFGQLLTN